MRCTNLSPSLATLFLENLEPRIAPAVILVGPDPSVPSSSIGYDDTPFIKASESPDPSLRTLFSGSQDHFYLNLASRDVVQFYDNTDGYKNFIKVDAGRVFAFFFDANGNNAVEKDELAGFALAQGTRLSVAGTVNGDIVGNLDARTQQLSSVSGPSGDLSQSLLPVSVARLSIDGDVNGRIITGANLSNVSVKPVDQITTASDCTYTFDWSGGDVNGGVGQAKLNIFAPAAGVTGGNISAVSVAGLADNEVLGARGAIVAGSGGAGGAGGSISGVTIVSDPNGFLIQAGNGTDGVRGGKGGDVRNLLVNTVPGASLVADLVEIRAGQGGDAQGAGGAGGTLTGLSIGYNSVGGILVETPLGDVVKISGGSGGSGATGGVGGSINNVKVALDVDASGPEFAAVAGNGGDGSRRDGNGGSLNNVTARNFNVAGSNDDAMDLRAGYAGGGGGGRGSGGSINQVTLLSNQILLTAGDGSDGPAGGRGGGISQVVLDVPQNSDFISFLQVAAGTGGDGVSGAGGLGGSITKIAGKSVDLVGLPSEFKSGDGGDSTTGRGGGAGGISSVKLTEGGRNPAPTSLNFLAGSGGDGGAGGGAGGTLNNLTFQGFATSVLMAAGTGGDATVRGSGGSGGGVGAAAVQVMGGVLADGRILAGSGGDSAGANGRGGTGGKIASATMIYAGNAEITGGQGGSDGPGGTASSVVGAGGGVSRAAIQALAGNATVQAGDAGVPVAAGVRGVGGAVTNVSVAALGDVLVTGGDGHAGGAGGAVSNLSWFGVSAGQADAGAAPSGTVMVNAGQGSVGPRSSGAGGSITNISGYASANALAKTVIAAGEGNGGVAGARAAAGGSISQVRFFGGAGVIEILAGQGGSIDPALATGGTGGAGGSVAGVNAAAGLDVKTIAAGDGGDAEFTRGRGGLGGSVSTVNVGGDIGYRTGQVFGIDTMGGVFAGRGGSGDAASATADGRSGNVQTVTASAISSIVAGRPSSSSPFDFSMVNLLDRVLLSGLAAPTVDASGAFNATSAPGATPPEVDFNVANLVGGVAGNPQAAGANVFKILVGGTPTDVPSDELPMRAGIGGGFEYKASDPADWKLFQPIDGFVAAQQLGANKNFRPEALVTLLNQRDPASLTFLDYRNDFNQNA